jgi:hypothetical protein
MDRPTVIIQPPITWPSAYGSSRGPFVSHRLASMDDAQGDSSFHTEASDISLNGFSVRTLADVYIIPIKRKELT